METIHQNPLLNQLHDFMQLKGLDGFKDSWRKIKNNSNTGPSVEDVFEIPENYRSKKTQVQPIENSTNFASQYSEGFFIA